MKTVKLRAFRAGRFLGAAILSLSMVLLSAFTAPLFAARALTTEERTEWRAHMARVALAQLKKPAADWEPRQRDCAGFVRYVYRATFQRVGHPWLWQVDGAQKAPFADAETLLRYNFTLLGRDLGALSPQTGDILAFAQRPALSEPERLDFHLMLIVTSVDPAHHSALALYHPGDGRSEVHVRTLGTLQSEAPMEWRAVPENRAFLGLFRAKSLHLAPQSKKEPSHDAHH